MSGSLNNVRPLVQPLVARRHLQLLPAKVIPLRPRRRRGDIVRVVLGSLFLALVTVMVFVAMARVASRLGPDLYRFWAGWPV